MKPDIELIKTVITIIFTFITSCLGLFLGFVFFWKKVMGKDENKAEKKEKTETKFAITASTLKNHEFFNTVQNMLLHGIPSKRFREQYEEAIYRDFLTIIFQELRDTLEDFVKKDIALKGDNQQWLSDLLSPLWVYLARTKQQIIDAQIPEIFPRYWDAAFSTHMEQGKALFQALTNCPIHPENGSKTCTALTFFVTVLTVCAVITEELIRTKWQDLKPHINGYVRKVEVRND